MSTMTKEAVAMDCEMVGAGQNKEISLVARVSLVNEDGACILDTYVKPTKPVTDYRTIVSGITPAHLENGKEFEEVKKDVAKLITGRILVGHSVDKDLQVLMLCHPESDIRDIAYYPPFQTGNQITSLKQLAQKHFGLSIQQGPHSSVQDAKVAMQLYKTVKSAMDLASQQKGKK